MFLFADVSNLLILYYLFVISSRVLYVVLLSFVNYIVK